MSPNVNHHSKTLVRVKLPKWYLMERAVLNAWKTIKTKMCHCPGESQGSRWGGCSAKVSLPTCPILALAGGSYCEQSAKSHVAFPTHGWKWQGWLSSLLGLQCSGGKGEWLSSAPKPVSHAQPSPWCMVSAIFLRRASDGAINKTDDGAVCEHSALPRWRVCSSPSIYLEHGRHRFLLIKHFSTCMKTLVFISNELVAGFDRPVAQSLLLFT